MSHTVGKKRQNNHNNHHPAAAVEIEISQHIFELSEGHYSIFILSLWRTVGLVGWSHFSAVETCWNQVVGATCHFGTFTEGSLEVKLPTIWTDGKAEVVRVSKSRRKKIREEKEREERRCRCASIAPRRYNMPKISLRSRGEPTSQHTLLVVATMNSSCMWNGHEKWTVGNPSAQA